MSYFDRTKGGPGSGIRGHYTPRHNPGAMQAAIAVHDLHVARGSHEPLDQRITNMSKLYGVSRIEVENELYRIWPKLK